MGSPTDLFAHLSLDSPLLQEPIAESIEDPMPSSEEVRARAVILQDILSSFETEKLPWECAATYFNNIMHNMQSDFPSRPRQQEWTVQGKLDATLLQYGSYDDLAWEVCRQMQTPTLRARLFLEKLARRFNKCRDEYDELVEDPPTATETRNRLQGILGEFMTLSHGFSADRDMRLGEEEQPHLQVEIQTLQVALDVLRNVCRRTSVVIPAAAEPGRRSSRRTPSASNSNFSLFGMLIRDAKPEKEQFLLDALDKFSGSALHRYLDDLIAINTLLTNNRAPDFYIARFEALQQKANDESQPVPSGVSGRQSGLEADPRPGSKRAQPAAEATIKRGKRTGR